MAISVTGKLNKAANQFQAGDSTGFGVRLGVRYYDRETKQNEYTNYEAVIFAKAPNQVQFYQQALVEGSVIEISGTTQKIKSFDGQNGQVLSIEIHDAKLGFVHTGQQAPQQQGGYGQPQQPQQQQYNTPQQQPQQQYTPPQNPYSAPCPDCGGSNPECKTCGIPF